MQDVSIDECLLEEGQTLENIKYETALEYFEYNIEGIWKGDFTPIHIYIEE